MNVCLCNVPKTDQSQHVRAQQWGRPKFSQMPHGASKSRNSLARSGKELNTSSFPKLMIERAKEWVISHPSHLTCQLISLWCYLVGANKLNNLGQVKILFWEVDFCPVGQVGKKTNINVEPWMSFCVHEAAVTGNSQAKIEGYIFGVTWSALRTRQNTPDVTPPSLPHLLYTIRLRMSMCVCITHIVGTKLSIQLQTLLSHHRRKSWSP